MKKGTRFFIILITIFFIVIIAVFIVNIKLNKDTIGLNLPSLNQYVYSEVSPHKYAIKTKDWKLIYYSDTGSCELYNLNEDKLEKNNLSKQKPELTYELMQRLLEWQRERKMPNNVPDNRLDLTDEMKKRIREAGYW